MHRRLPRRASSGIRCRQFRAHLLAQHVDRHQRAFDLELPEGPAIAGIQPLHMRAHLMDRAGGIGAGQGAVGAHLGGLMRCADRTARCPTGSRPRSTTQPKGMRGSARLDLVTSITSLSGRLDFGDAGARHIGIGLFALDADEVAAQPLGHRAGGAGAEEGIQDHIARLGGGERSRGAAAIPASGWNGPSGRRRP